MRRPITARVRALLRAVRSPVRLFRRAIRAARE
jgi:hypothetical protein